MKLEFFLKPPRLSVGLFSSISRLSISGAAVMLGIN
jgi:hypothetical protein